MTPHTPIEIVTTDAGDVVPTDPNLLPDPTAAPPPPPPAEDY